MRLIDADALKKEIEGLVVGGAEGLKDYYENGSKSDENAWIGGIYDAWELIDNAPTVEPENTGEDILNAIKLGFNDGYEMAKAKFERPQPDMSKVTRYHDTSIDALIDEALDELSETKHQTSETADDLCEVHLLSKKQDVPFCEVKTERGGASK